MQNLFPLTTKDEEAWAEHGNEGGRTTMGTKKQETIDDKLLDFGVFGKWSEKTLKAQSRCYVGCYDSLEFEMPIGIKKKMENLTIKGNKIRDTRVRRMWQVQEYLEELEEIKQADNDYNRMKETIRKLHGKKEPLENV